MAASSLRNDQIIVTKSNRDMNLGKTGSRNVFEDVMTRSLMSYPPARIILLDVAHPFEAQAGKLLCDALENTLCISANMAGLSCVPLIGIYLLTSYPENVLPLTCSKGNFVRLHSSLMDIRSFLDESLQEYQSREIESCIVQGMLEAYNQYKRYVGNLVQGAITFKQLELIVFTGNSGDIVQKQIETLANQLDLSMIKRIVNATINCSLTVSDAFDSPDVPTFDAICDEFSGLVDLVTLDCDPVSLQKFFYTWLMDTTCESEQLHLLLPPPNPTEPNLVIKCDFTERMLSPAQLPFSDAYCLHVQSNACKNIFPTSSKAIGMTVPIQQLKVIRRLPRNALCESVLFGFPLIILPTVCWKIDWEVLEKNQQNFISLCQELLTKDQVLLAQLVDWPPKVPASSTRCEWRSTKLASTVPKPSGYFVLMPSEQRTLLVKSVVSRELLLPTSQTVTSGLPSEESDQRVQASLSQVEIVNGFNPLNYESRLYAALRNASLPKSAVDKVRTLKRKAGFAQTKPEWNSSCAPLAPKTVEKGGRVAVNSWSASLRDYQKST